MNLEVITFTNDPVEVFPRFPPSIEELVIIVNGKWPRDVDRLFAKRLAKSLILPT